ncbi:MAG: MFS transporter, partial [Terrimicrobiaceae bacterium]
LRHASPAPTRLRARTKAGWGTGGFLENTVGNSIGVMALPIFNIALGLSPIWLGWAMSIPRLLDAIIDPVLGTLSDNTRSRWGRRRPWIFGAAIITPILLALLWSVPPHWSQTAIFVWFAIICTAVYVLMSVYSISYNALGFELTTDYNERTSVQAWRFFFIAVSGLLVGWIYRISLSPILAGEPVGGVAPEVLGMRNLMWILVPLLIVVGIAPVFFGKSESANAVLKQEKIGLRNGFTMTMRNRPFVIFILLGIFGLTGGALVGPFGLYLGIFYVCDGNKELATTIAGVGTILNTVLSFLFIAIIPKISASIGKRETLLIAQIVLMLAAVSTWFFFDRSSPWLMIAVTPLNCFALSCFLILNGSILADVCDFDELTTGLRREGMYGAVAAFIGKIAGSSVGILSGYMLLWAGYTDEKSISDEVLFRMRLMYVAVPTTLGMIGLLFTIFFPLTRSRMREIRSEITRRQAGYHGLANDLR